MIGRSLAHYRILAKIGEGGMGTVYRAEDTRLRRQVALKLLPPEWSADRSRLARLEREARALAALNHPAIVTIHAVEEAEDIRFLAMELVEGETLAAAIPRGGLPLARFFAIAEALAGALAAAHDRGITHRDLKPGNVMLLPDGRVKVLDFGLAKLAPAAADTEATLAASEELTGEGQVVGTAPYMSPEQIQGAAVDARSDIFSLGAVLYQMAVGERPFRGASSGELVSAILRDTPSAVTDLKPELPNHLARILRRCLEKDPRKRYQSARDIENDLADLRREVAESDSREEAANPPAHPARRWAAPLAILAAIALAVGLFVGRGRRQAPPPAAGSERPAIAVLPLADLAGDPSQAFFADGMTEAMITGLAKVRGLRVTSRGSVMRYRDTEKTIPEIARELGVDYVLEGSVLEAGDQVRITAQLIEAATDSHLWADSYDAELADILLVQSQVAQAVARQVQVQLSPDEQGRLTAAATIDPEAYRFYLEGRYEWHQRTAASMQRSLGLFRQAVEREPTFALAWSGLADAYYVMAGYYLGEPIELAEQGFAAAQRALELDPGLAEAHSTLGTLYHYHKRDFVGAEREFRRAIELNPSYASAHQWYAEMLTSALRHDEALVEIERARQLDPLSPIVRYVEAETYYHARRFDSALELYRQASADDPGHWLFQFGLALTLTELGRCEEATAAAERCADLTAGVLWGRGTMMLTLARCGESERASEMLEQLERVAEEEVVPATFLALTAAALGDPDSSLRWIDEATAMGDPYAMMIGAMPGYDAIRSDPRFKERLRLLNLPEAQIP